uniref:Uncharacterized protein n=1 Tax=Solibacter usitatus (strain Ellin6076) TaxID=234267 RepID=Q026R0_SOLUE
MKAKLIAVMLLAAGAVCAQISVGIRIGPPPPVRVVRVQPRSPGPDYTWIAGYWYPVGNRYKWHEGYYTRPAYRGARWIEPRHEGGTYYNGYWKGDRGEVRHDHKWDKERGHNRDYNHNHE